MSWAENSFTVCHCEEALRRSNPDMKQYYVYILASQKNGTLYIGVTNDLLRRIFEHREGLVSGFTQRYKIHHLVYFETTDNIESAILREKQLKGGSRKKKLTLIETNNPDWSDLYDSLL